MSDRHYLAALYAFTDFGPARTNLLISYFGSAKKAWEADKGKLVEVGLKDGLVLRFCRYRQRFDIKGYFGRLEGSGVEIITRDDKEYPSNLAEIEDAPLVLYIKGTLMPRDKNAVAIVGTRKMTSYGKEVAYKFAGELASLGVTIVSGLALGIDAIAHRATLDAGGRCIAVIASGIDNITPRSNYQLANDIVSSGGAVLTESPIGAEIWRSSFPIRNRIVSGLTKAVVVIEGARKSGTLLTASHAANQGRQVFAVPGQITSPMSEAPHFLIQNGAKIAFSVNDILDELDLQLKVDKEEVEKLMPSDSIEAKLIEILANEPLHLDEAARISGLKISDISAKLTVMELKGMVRSLGNGVFKKV